MSVDLFTCCHCGEPFSEYELKPCPERVVQWCEDEPSDEPEVDDFREQPLCYGVELG